MAPFSEQLLADAAGVPMTLATLTGACTAGELAIASDSLPFGTVVLGSRTSKRLALANTGDVGVRFAWDAKALAPHFAVSPTGELTAYSRPGQCSNTCCKQPLSNFRITHSVHLYLYTEGFLAPGADLKLEVTFQPTTVDSDIRVERARCRCTGPDSRGG